MEEKIAEMIQDMCYGKKLLQNMTRYEFCRIAEPFIVAWFEKTDKKIFEKEVNSGICMARFCQIEECVCRRVNNIVLIEHNRMEEFSHYRDVLLYEGLIDLL